MQVHQFGSLMVIWLSEVPRRRVVNFLHGRGKQRVPQPCQFWSKTENHHRQHSISKPQMPNSTKLWWVVSISLCVLDDLLPMRFPCFLLALFRLLLAPATFGSSSSIHPEGGHLDVLQRLDSAAYPQHLRVFSVNKHPACGNGCLQKSAIVMRIGLK